MKCIKAIITVSLISMSFISFSQKGGRNIYNWSLGGRFEIVSENTDKGAVNLPTPLIGPAFKFLLDPQKSIEIAAMSDFKNGVQCQGIFNLFNPFPEVPQTFRYYVGMGLHAGTWKTPGNLDPFRFGADGQLGVELIPRDIPLALSIDWHPTFDIVTKSTNKIWLINFGLTIKYYSKH